MSRVGVTVGFRLSGAGLQFLLQVVMGNLLGAGGLGAFLLYASWMRLLETVFGLGFRQYVLRTLAPLETLHGRGWSLVIGVLKRVTIFGFAALVATGVTVFVWRWATGAPLRYGPLLMLAIGAAIAMAGIRIVADALKARHRANVGLLLEFNLEPTLLLVVVAAGWVVLRRLTLSTVVWFDVAVLYGTLMLALALWAATVKQSRPDGADEMATASPPVRGEPVPRRMILTYWAFNILSVLLWTLPYLILPVYADKQEIGLFGVSQRLVALATMIQVGLAAIFAPQFARAYAQRDRRRLRQSLLRSQALSLGAYLPLLLAFFLVPDLILGLFGAEFREARIMLWIMAAGQMINAGGGLAPEFLNMTGTERLELRVTAGAAATMVLLSALLGMWFGVMGVVVAYALTIAAKKSVSYLCCWFRLSSLRASSC